MSFKFLKLFHNMTFIDHILSIFYLRVFSSKYYITAIIILKPKQEWLRQSLLSTVAPLRGGTYVCV